MSKGSFGEPWGWDRGDIGDEFSVKYFDVFDREENVIADMRDTPFDGTAARIVECVNAMAGINNPVDAVEKARESLHNAIALWGHLSTDETQKLWLAEARAALAALGDGHE